MILHRALAATMMVAGGGVATYGLAGYSSTSDAFREALLVAFVLPALPGFALGLFMLLGQGWALRGLRVYVWVLLAFVAVMALVLGGSVLTEPAFAVPFAGFLLGWWALSLRLGPRMPI